MDLATRPPTSEATRYNLHQKPQQISEMLKLCLALMLATCVSGLQMAAGAGLRSTMRSRPCIMQFDFFGGE